MTEEQKPSDRPDQGEGSRGLAPKADRTPSWETAPDSPEPVGLTEAVRRATREAPLDREDRTSIGLRAVSSGFRAVLRRLAHEHFVSLSTFAMQALEVGMNQLDDEPWILALRDVYDRVSDAAIDQGRPSAMRRLDRRTPYGFRDSTEYHTTFPVARKTQARIADLADICGIYTSQMAVLAILRALLTLENNRGYRGAIEDELNTFREYVLHRILELRLPDIGTR